MGGENDELLGALCGESATASSGLLALIHDHILASSVAPPDAPPRGGRTARLLLTAASHLSVVAEITAERFMGGEGGKWGAITQLECFKAACRLSLLARRPDLVLLRGGHFTAPAPPQTPWDSPSALERAMAASAPAAAAAQKEAAKAAAGGGGAAAAAAGTPASYKGKRSGRQLNLQPSPAASPAAASAAALPSSAASASSLAARPEMPPAVAAMSALCLAGHPRLGEDSPARALDAPTLGRVAGFLGLARARARVEPAMSPLCASASAGARQQQLLGEILAVLRPVLYVVARRRWGPRSWIPWLLSLFVDLAAAGLSGAAANGASAAAARAAEKAGGLGGSAPAAPADTRPALEELARRRSQLSYYLLRSPVFELVTKPAALRLCKACEGVPLLGPLSQFLVVSTLFYYQRLHFYVSAS